MTVIKKRGIKIELSNRWLYTIIAIGILIIIGVGVYAYVGPSGVGHDLEDIEPCSNGQILQTSAGTWSCVDMPSGGITTEVDPTVPSSIKDGISWGEVSDIPLGFADSIDNTGITAETDPTVLASVKDGVSWSEITSRPIILVRGVEVYSIHLYCNSPGEITFFPTCQTRVYVYSWQRGESMYYRCDGSWGGWSSSDDSVTCSNTVEGYLVN